jgi:hypothetical protein
MYLSWRSECTPSASAQAWLENHRHLRGRVRITIRMLMELEIDRRAMMDVPY